jgi:hypothetical protein
LWLHEIRDASWYSTALLWAPLVVAFNYLIIYFSILNGWVLSKAAILGPYGTTFDAEEKLFSTLATSRPKTLPVPMFLYWFGMVLWNAVLTWIGLGRMVDQMVVAEWGPQKPPKLEPGIELVPQEHHWQIATLQCIWIVLAIICHRYIRNFTSGGKNAQPLEGHGK